MKRKEREPERERASSIIKYAAGLKVLFRLPHLDPASLSVFTSE